MHHACSNVCIYVYDQYHCVFIALGIFQGIFLSRGGYKAQAFSLTVLVSVQSSRGLSCLDGPFCHVCIYGMLCVSHNINFFGWTLRRPDGQYAVSTLAVCFYLC